MSDVTVRRLETNTRTLYGGRGADFAIDHPNGVETLRGTTREHVEAWADKWRGDV